MDKITIKGIPKTYFFTGLMAFSFGSVGGTICSVAAGKPQLLGMGLVFILISLGLIYFVVKGRMAYPWIIIDQGTKKFQVKPSPIKALKGPDKKLTDYSRVFISESAKTEEIARIPQNAEEKGQTQKVAIYPRYQIVLEADNKDQFVVHTTYFKDQAEAIAKQLRDYCGWGVIETRNWLFGIANGQEQVANKKRIMDQIIIKGTRESNYIAALMAFSFGVGGFAMLPFALTSGGIMGATIVFLLIFFWLIYIFIKGRMAYPWFIVDLKDKSFYIKKSPISPQTKLQSKLTDYVRVNVYESTTTENVVHIPTSDYDYSPTHRRQTIRKYQVILESESGRNFLLETSDSMNDAKKIAEELRQVCGWEEVELKQY